MGEISCKFICYYASLKYLDFSYLVNEFATFLLVCSDKNVVLHFILYGHMILFSRVTFLDNFY